MIDDFIPLIIMAKNHDLVAQNSLGLGGSAKEFLGRQLLVVGNRFSNRR
jgi:hypothetical protein